jgi:hypothetical protein
MFAKETKIMNHFYSNFLMEQNHDDGTVINYSVKGTKISSSFNLLITC